MFKYKVAYWFSHPGVNKTLLPSVVIDVESDEELTENEAIRKGLEKIGTYSRTYSAKVEKIN